ncbi:MAG: MlaE family lipid ABC transporter permease subunit [Gammaproteobacteria bacterium]|nr:MlaE family lipid ABC transporter permease subunit [Gammaproteobacteria bacterium]MBI5615921.1 MlaE family lipid ABC transporter permease subunit [Gammaproteobacteria bacterium]
MTNDTARAPATDAPASIESEPAARRLILGGAWTTARIAAAVRALDGAAAGMSGRVRLDGGAIAQMDTAGAWLLLGLEHRLRERGCEVELAGLAEDHAALVRYVGTRTADAAPPPAPTIMPPVARLGLFATGGTIKAISLLSFLGETVITLAKAVLDPRRLRFGAMAAIVQRAGVEALPIVMLLSFLLGVVIAYQGGVQLKSYGANIFVVELVSITMARELAPMMTAIIVAGRTGSAFTAEIGTMKATEEIDALRTIGLPPIDVLVLPRLIGLVIALPLLSLVGDAAGIFGGMIMAWAMLDVSVNDFLHRIPTALSATSFMIGIGKAPVFALLIAIVGCFEGFSVRGGAEAVGRHTTVSVVHSIFLVIVADAVFSIVFSWLGI